MSEQVFAGRGGAGNIFPRRVSQDTTTGAPTISSRTQGGNFAGRGGAGNYKSKDTLDSLPSNTSTSTTTASKIGAPSQPIVYKGGRGGRGNIEAVQTNEKNKEDQEILELLRVHSELQDSGTLPRPITEQPILRID